MSYDVPAAGAALIIVGSLIAVMVRVAQLRETTAQLALREARVRELELLLHDALSSWEEASQYKGEFLQKKHGDLEDIAVARAALTPAPALAPKEPTTVEFSKADVESLTLSDEAAAKFRKGPWI